MNGLAGSCGCISIGGGVGGVTLAHNYGRFLAMHSSVVFCVYIDGKPAGESPVMRMSQEPWRFDIPVPPGSKRLSISCRNAGTNSLLDSGDWVDGGFIK